jgi:predicted nucleic acid-binding protein
MRIYLDNCCFNRPFDDQGQIRIRLEAEAKLFIQQQVMEKRLELAWSYILDFENSANPFPERKTSIARWKSHAAIYVVESAALLALANEIQSLGVASKDALHVACSIEAKCSYFMTTDDQLLKNLSDYGKIAIMNPVRYVTEARGEALR